MCLNRTAIESELSSLYDAYYDELESYALHQQRYASLPPGTIPPPPGPGPFPGSVDASAIPATPPADGAQPPGSGGATTGGGGPNKPARERVVKPTRDHKNVRPAAKKAAPRHAPPAANHAPPPAAAAAAAVPPVPPAARDAHHHHQHHGANPGHGEPGHTHSPSCPHHPHHHGAGNDARQKNKAAVVHPEEPDEDEYDEDEEGEYDEDEEGDDAEGEYDDEEDEDEDDEEVRLRSSRCCDRHD